MLRCFSGLWFDRKSPQPFITRFAEVGLRQVTKARLEKTLFNFFKKATPNPAAASAEGDAPPGEVEKVARIQQLCWVAGMRGESIAGLSEADLQDEHMQYELNRFTKFQHEAINLAREITDTFYRDAALDLLIGSYLKTGYEAEAKRLYEIIEIDIIQDKVRKDYPRLAAKF